MPREAFISLGREPFAARVTVADNTFTIDEPRELGGGDTGPTPAEVLLSSLAACKAITAKMYADRKSWPLEGVDAVARASAMDGYAVAEIEVQLRFRGDLSAEQRERLLGIAEKCPVQKAITTGVKVTATLTAD